MATAMGIRITMVDTELTDVTGGSLQPRDSDNSKKLILRSVDHPKAAPLLIYTMNAIESTSVQDHTMVTAYKTRLCQNFQDGSKCSYGKRCLFAHGDSELRKVPTETQLCRNLAKDGECHYGKHCCVHRRMPKPTRALVWEVLKPTVEDFLPSQVLEAVIKSSMRADAPEFAPMGALAAVSCAEFVLN
uniref:Zinc finger protein n=1 Tax=Marseillevirus LCMAC202 TaxID=2506606 RepID=A0A481YYD4_9VIRU|nr:MAG: zinc finger protein [Marseillevirus LCMAC202]